MQNIYQVKNSYFLLEGLDSEFLIVAANEEEAIENCLELLRADQDMHITTIRETIANLEKSIQKQWANTNPDDPSAAFILRAQERSKENVAKYKMLLSNFHGYRGDCLSVRKVDYRLKNGCIQYEDGSQSERL